MKGRYIPTDVLLNILLRIPASSLQRLKYVSKVWFQIISDPDFAEVHHTHQSREKFGWSFIIGSRKDILFIGEALSSNPNVPRRIYLPGAHGETHIYRSYKGLVLFQCGTSLHVANPITGDLLSLPPFYRYSCSILGASMDCVRDGEIKVVVVARRCQYSAAICRVLTLGSGAWRKLDIPIRRHLLEPFVEPILAAGALHLIYDTGVLSLGLLQEKFHQTRINFCSNVQLKCHSKYLEWHGCFAVISFQHPSLNSFYRVWLLKESEWMRLPDIDVAFFDRLGCPCTVDLSSGVNRPYLLATMRNGEVILFWQVSKGRMYIFAYDLVCQAMTYFTQFEDKFTVPYLVQNYCYFMTNMSSLISCSSYDSSKKTELGGEGTIKPVLAFDLAIKVSTYFGRTLSKLFRS